MTKERMYRIYRHKGYPSVKYGKKIWRLAGVFSNKEEAKKSQKAFLQEFGKTRGDIEVVLTENGWATIHITNKKKFQEPSSRLYIRA